MLGNLPPCNCLGHWPEFNPVDPLNATKAGKYSLAPLQGRQS